MATIAEEISALRQRISQAYDVIDQKGGDVPFDRTSWNLSTSIDSIRTGDADPAAIVPVRYLKSTGTQYIDTIRYITSQNNVNEAHIELDYQLDELVQGRNQRIWGAWNTNTIHPYYQVGANSLTSLIYIGNTAIASGIVSDTLRHKMVFDTRTNQAWVDGQLSTISYTSYGTTWTTALLFAAGSGTTGGLVESTLATGRIYRYRHLQNENIMRDLIPARIGTEGVMYDINTGEILHNQGTGDFEYGLDVIPALRNAVQVMYLQFSGTQGFDTGIQATQNTRCDLVFQGVGSNPSTAQYVFGARNEPSVNTFTILHNTTAWNLDIGAALYRLTANYSSYPYTDPSHCCIAAEQRSLLGQRIGLKMLDRTVRSDAFTTNTTMRIGLKPTTGYADTIANYTGRFWGGQIWEGTTLVRDFVPCRIGTTGYLYDRVSQTLFSNIGTGDFVLGPDVG